MKLILISYASAAIVVPALWIGMRLWLRRHSRTPIPSLVSAQIIAFPVAMRGGKPTARADLLGKRTASGSRAANDGA